MPLTLQTFANDKVKNTAYDEVINDILSQIRTKAGNIANADLPYEPKEEKQIRLGRNKLLISDMHGDGKQIFMTFKTRRDQQISFILNEDADLISQVRIRGAYGESMLLESKGTNISSPEFSRFTYKGIQGQLFEVYDDAQTNKNYIYMLSSDDTNAGPDYLLSKASYFLISNDSIPTGTGFTRLTNNVGIPNVGPTTAMGVYDTTYALQRALYYDTGNNKINSTESVKYGSNGVQDNKIYDLNSDSITHQISRIVGGNMVLDTTNVSPSLAESIHSATAGSTYVQTTYNGAAEKFSVVNSKNSKIEMAASTITVDATTVNLGDATAKVARVGDLVQVAGITGTITSATSNTKVNA